ncbi:uncharacterized protein LOC114244542 [Bombyx mandarina]|uniref:Cold-related protein n=2 Tax=Bombyx TaxID=7090 RepID=C6K2I0_BOMMO|nr:cold-related protein precursor [Bombyx mori]XP_028032197.1 uncharacterized protein LOC114244542 [Bombyx mandarina]ACS44813.1 cold-related protein [Bombyx mori]
MKLIQCVFVIVLLMAVTVCSSPLLTQTPFSEEDCIRQGGICVRTEECDPDNISTISQFLCPNQAHLGVACCYV